MTVLNPPIAVQARADHAADDLRGAMQSARMAAGGTLLPRQGIVPGWGAELSVAQRAAGANMSVDVGSGVVLLPAPTAGHGGWPLINDAALNLAIAAAHATLPRIDLVIARVGDAQYYAGGDGLATIKVITGTAAASPAVPAVPTADGAYQVLAQVAVAAAATSITNANITQNTSSVRPYSVAAGGILPVANAAARTALTPHLGLHVIEADTKREYVWDGATWAIMADPGAWTAFTPTWGGGGGTAPTLGNGTAEGWYKKIGRVVHFRLRITLGTTSNAGTASSYSFGGLPFPAKDVAALAGLTGAALGSNGTYVIGTSNGLDTSTLAGISGSSGQSLANNAPAALVATAWIQYAGTYESAS